MLISLTILIEIKRVKVLFFDILKINESDHKSGHFARKLLKQIKRGSYERD